MYKTHKIGEKVTIAYNNEFVNAIIERVNTNPAVIYACRLENGETVFRCDDGINPKDSKVGPSLEDWKRAFEAGKA